MNRVARIDSSLLERRLRQQLRFIWIVVSRTSRARGRSLAALIDTTPKRKTDAGDFRRPRRCAGFKARRSHAWAKTAGDGDDAPVDQENRPAGRDRTAEAGRGVKEDDDMATDQVLPVRMYQTEDRIMIAAPMPGLEPDDITVVIDGRHVTLRGRERGRHQHERSLLLTEWALGPYHREVDVPEPVDGGLANVTYDNGVVVVAMPKLAAGGTAEAVEIRLEATHATRGQHVGHVGRQIAPSTTREHRAGKRGGRRETTGAAVSSEARAGGGYAHVNVWHLGAGDDGSDTGAADAIGERLRERPGFRSYTVVRTGRHEIVAVTVFDSEAQLHAALEAVESLVQSRVRPIAAARPERRQGPVLHHEAAA
jgi:HSP20 family protein